MCAKRLVDVRRGVCESGGKRPRQRRVEDGSKHGRRQSWHSRYHMIFDIHLDGLLEHSNQIVFNSHVPR